MRRLDGKVAIITGGNSGVGAATAIKFAAARDGKWGAMITYYTNEENAAEKEIELSVLAEGKMTLSLLDGTHDGEAVDTVPTKTLFRMQPNAVAFLTNA